MATNTTNYGWTKPDYEDDADIAVLNETFDAIDAQLKTNENNISTVQTSLEVGQNDDGKVLTATYSGGTGTYSWVTPSGGGGTSDYTALSNKPQIGGITLTGNKSLSDLGIAPASAVTLVSGLNTTGTIKNGSSETSATGYIASPIISGIPYYKDTTYESKSEASGGTAVSLCTTGEKYTWNNKSTLQLTNSTTPIVDGTAAIGTSTYAAKADHVHPTDTSRQAAITAQSPLSADVVSDTNTTHKFATQTQLDQISTNANNILLIEQLNGQKNVLKYDSLETTNANGVTYTINSDYSVTVTDSASRSGTSYVILKIGSGYAFIDDFCNGDYILSGCPSGGSESTYWLYASAGNYYKADTGNGILLSSTAETGIRVILRISGAYISTPITLKPMIRRKELDSTYDAYGMTNGQLTSAIRAIQTQLANT